MSWRRAGRWKRFYAARKRPYPLPLLLLSLLIPIRVTWIFIKGLSWLTYALLRQDIATIVPAFFQALTSGLIVAIKLVRR
jgi:hypothetical protein